jgi:hypothetical protein
VFSEVFLVQTWNNLGKRVPKYFFNAKNIWKTRSDVFIQGQKMNFGGKKTWGR